MTPQEDASLVKTRREKWEGERKREMALVHHKF
jgi:hypothetical protein